jgi:hypothetical protein
MISTPSWPVGPDGVEIVVDAKVAAAKPVGVVRSQPGREAETKS